MLNAVNTSSGSAKKKKKKERKKENAATVFGSKGKDTWISIVKVTPRNDKAPIENCQEKKKTIHEPR
jgi:hypothetical protein